jgi:cysteinyl-tRNA synthetase
MVNKEKMSKSLGNFFTVRDILKRFQPEVVRFFILNTHYQSPLDFSDAGLEEAQRSLARIQNAVMEAEARQGHAPDTGGRDSFVTSRLEECKKKFEAAMDDNLNTREAIAEVFEMTRDVNKWLANGSMSKQDWNDILGLYDTYSGILGVNWKPSKEGDGLTSELLALLVDIRAAVRKKKDYETSDLIRSRLKDLGITIEDSKEGVKIKRIP